jgi:vacuolar-type H+-ATPase catalytic subunit A/Vma1
MHSEKANEVVVGGEVVGGIRETEKIYTRALLALSRKERERVRERDQNR